VVAHHIYNLGAGVDKHLVEKILDPSYLSREESMFKGLKTFLENFGPCSRAWVGEAGGAYNSGHNLVTNAFVFSFWNEKFQEPDFSNIRHAEKQK
ncbi:hypothetical protein KI387_031145, partial [Taxus chinensis]